ncbi:MAG: phosphoribosylformylglycinamidine synthase subunit PurQ [Actinobacteria bacterium]|nr:phosphoribosylformylglycinamidine synthase subunit PurQ [Actinomycetota bacterium]MBU1943361.1 phosphoribosylformylglycinamidine synthase subunit PurQ [Actinomycetota bacterium]MBU2686521.1 phosphoribosylformylglycinamidine synthase subunit PurQ [Actinomycetota bacterium]
MKFGVVVFPGSNCDHDCHYVIREVLGQDVDYVWHGSTDVRGYDCLVLPGGFSYGDYLRTGAVARFSPVMKAVEEFAAAGGYVIGICNGFQILLEAGLLPGAMMRNTGLKFVCRFVDIRVETTSTPWTNSAKVGEVLSIPIAHNEGNYQVPPDALEEMKRRGQVVFRYSSPEGSVLPEFCPNGSNENIAGICSREGNVLGMMPHPERASEAELGSSDGLVIWNSLLAHCGASV